MLLLFFTLTSLFTPLSGQRSQQGFGQQRLHPHLLGQQGFGGQGLGFGQHGFSQQLLLHPQPQLPPQFADKLPAPRLKKAAIKARAIGLNMNFVIVVLLIKRFPLSYNL